MLAALTNALRVVDKKLEDVRIVVSGVGAAGHAIVRLLAAQGATRHHRLRPARRPRPDGRHRATSSAAGSPRTPTPPVCRGRSKEVLAGADVFVGVSAPNLLDGDDIATMAERAVVFALANPDPEVDPVAASRHAAVVATGRSDYANQINNVLAFPGFFRGLLDAGASDITDEMMIAAATAIADCVHPDELNASYIVPSVFDADVAPAVAAAVRKAAGGSTRTPAPPLTQAPPRPPTEADPPDDCGPERPERHPRRAARATPMPALARQFPGERAIRQPVHTVYVPADRYDADLVPRWRAEALAVLDEHGRGVTDLADAFGLRPDLAVDLDGRLRDKLEREPIEDLRIDFEDGYGARGRRRGGRRGRRGRRVAPARDRLRATARPSTASGSRASRRRPGSAGCAPSPGSSRR